MPKNYRVGIIGHTKRGNYGHAVDEAFTKLDNVTIAAVADADEAGLAAAMKRTKAAKAYADYRAMIKAEKLDIVAICPRWIDQHHHMLMAAADAGCHVYAEKPFCRTLAECDEVVNAFDMRHLKLGIAHHAQYSPVLDKVVQLIKGGEIGDVLELRGRGKEDQRGGGEDLWVLGSHIFGMMRTFGGGQPRSCTATVWQSGHLVTQADVKEGNEGIGPLAGDHVQATYDFGNGITGYFASQKAKGGTPSRFALQIYGSKGIVEIETNYLTPAYILRDAGWSPGRSKKQWEKITSGGIGVEEPRTDNTYQDGHIMAINDLIASIEGMRDTKCTPRDCRDIIEMIAAVFESHRVGGAVKLPLETRANPLTLLK